MTHYALIDAGGSRLATFPFLSQALMAGMTWCAPGWSVVAVRAEV